MAKPQKCDLCGEPATVHLTQIVNNQIHKVDLCETCAEQKGITDPNGYSLADLLVKPDAKPMELAGADCAQCGCTPKDFKKSGRLGCPACYSSFEMVLEQALLNMHRGDRHKGKAPQRALSRISYAERLGSLELDLKQAISSEQYEEAAKMRDEIIELKRAMEQTAPKQ